jgi:putative transposase
MIDRNHPLPIARQAKVLGLSRSTVYYTPKPPPAKTLSLMRRIDELHMEHPFMGARMIRDTLRSEGIDIGRRQVRTLMRAMGIQALYRAPRTTQKHPDHQVFPYLLRKLSITRPNHVWAMDITYIPMAQRFCYLAVVLDWATRKVLAHELSISMDSDFCVRAMETAMRLHGTPEIVNTDQGAQFTSGAFTRPLLDSGIRISMDGRGAWRDNVFVERLWRSVKYEEVYLRAYDTVTEARSRIARYLEFYNARRPHSSLDGVTPDHAYFGGAPSLPLAA